VYTWGINDCGQLGHRDTVQRNTPHKIEALDSKRVTSFSLGKDYVVALGLTLPLKDNARVRKDYDSQTRKNERSSD
jgi:alpha-tubulin suppressor-like RCC1 family protein